ncbi:LacI family DNA-binding transcriptional regulator [Enterococcus sp. LJL128]|uniref:LacI family DNA-binding transcriptional regulator n=1 Tax=Enterococcus sp. LJL51 TaxID=3416656 RepID=UPI003CED01D3
MRVTIKQIAQEAGVSITTVSNVINKKAHRVSKDKIDLIEEIIKKYNYAPNMNARALVQSSSKLIGLLYYSDKVDIDFSDPFVTEVLEGIERRAKEAGMFTLIHNVTSVEDVEAVQRNWKFEGFIAVGVSAEFFSEINKIIQAPVVFVDTHLTDEESYLAEHSNNRVFINTDDFEAGLIATRFLIENGHKRFAFLTYPFDEDTTGVIEQRYQGFNKALRNSNLSFERRHLYTRDDFDQMAARLTEFTAVVVTADFLAVSFIHSLKVKGLYDREKIAVIGFDDIKYAEINDPPLTTIRLDHVKKGEMALIKLLEIIEEPDKENQSLYFLSGELIVRQSVTKVTE